VAALLPLLHDLLHLAVRAVQQQADDARVRRALRGRPEAHEQQRPRLARRHLQPVHHDDLGHVARELAVQRDDLLVHGQASGRAGAGAYG